MSRRLRLVGVAAIWLVTLALCLAYSVVAIAQGTSLGDAASALVGVTFSTVGVIIAAKRGDNRVGWIFLGVGVSLALNGFAFTYADYLRERGAADAWHWFAWIGTWSWQPGFVLLMPTLFLVFPDGHIQWRRGRAFLRIAIVGFLGSLAGTLWNPADLPSMKGYENPIGIESLLDASDYLLVAGTVLWIPLALFASVRALHLRFRTASGVEREQLKWFVFAGFATLVFYVTGSSLYNMFGSTAGGVVAVFGVPLLPAATAVAILRYRLYDIDRIVNRTLVYGALTVVLAGAYLLMVVLMQGFLEPLTSESDVAVAASTLAVAALFRPLRTRVQSFIDHTFYRRKYDAASVVDSFSARLRDQLDLHSLSEELVDVVTMTMQPAHASLWLRGSETR